jgi:hypothetical protein
MPTVLSAKSGGPELLFKTVSEILVAYENIN